MYVIPGIGTLEIEKKLINQSTREDYNKTKRGKIEISYPAPQLNQSRA